MPKEIRTPCGNCNSEEYCDPPRKDNEFEWITGVNLNENSLTSGREEGAYGNFIGQTTFIVEQGKSYDLSISAGFKDNPVEENYGVWVDYNMDGNFTSNEQVLDLDDLNTTTVTGTIQIPSNTEIGITRMRVVQSFNRTPRACENTSGFGEVEDYCIQIDALGTAVNDPFLNDNFEVFPIPFSDELNINLLNQLEAQLNIYDLNGRQVFESSALLNQQINTEKWESGLYILTIQNGPSRSSQKLVKI